MRLRSAGYFVSFENNSFSYLKNYLQEHTFSSVFILCDTNTRKHCLPRVKSKIKAISTAKTFFIPAGEKYKTLETTSACWNFLLANGADRNSLLICIGGGVVCDLGGFAASTFMRGIKFIHVPTTLLAMADASVGGKTGIDLRGYKNMIGTITQPQEVFVQESFLGTLPQRHLDNGMAEIIKAALIGDTVLWNKFLTLKKIPSKNFTNFIRSSVKVKNKIVIKDPFEKNTRKVLNFGHTAGHAIETYFLHAKKPLLHGEAIVMGMCVELCLGKITGLTKAQAAMEAILFLKNNYPLKKFKAEEINSFLNLLRADKKNKGGKLNFALVEQPGKPHINVTAEVEEVKSAFILYNNLLV